jgi:hypothetical protein
MSAILRPPHFKILIRLVDNTIVSREINGSEDPLSGIQVFQFGVPGTPLLSKGSGPE